MENKETLYRVSTLKTYFSGPLKNSQVPWSVKYPLPSALRVAQSLIEVRGLHKDVNGHLFGWASGLVKIEEA